MSLSRRPTAFSQTEAWPQTYEDLQPVPVLKAGQLTFAGDDGMQKGQTYRAKIDFRQVCDLASHQERTPLDCSCACVPEVESGEVDVGAGLCHDRAARAGRRAALPGAMPQAPTLREIRGDDGSRVAVLDVILEVPAKYVGDLEQERRVLGWDWGVRSLNYGQRPRKVRWGRGRSRTGRSAVRCFWRVEVWMGARAASGARLTGSRPAVTATRSWSKKRSSPALSKDAAALRISRMAGSH